jgi:hypothetical protein
MDTESNQARKFAGRGRDFTRIPDPSLRLLLGKAALNGARGKLDSLKKDFDAWEKTTVEAEFS